MVLAFVFHCLFGTKWIQLFFLIPHINQTTQCKSQVLNKAMGSKSKPKERTVSTSPGLDGDLFQSRSKDQKMCIWLYKDSSVLCKSQTCDNQGFINNLGEYFHCKTLLFIFFELTFKVKILKMQWVSLRHVSINSVILGNKYSLLRNWQVKPPSRKRYKNI